MAPGITTPAPPRDISAESPASNPLSYTLKPLRLAAGMTRSQLGKAAGVDEATIRRWELGLCDPPWIRLPKLARALGCTIDELFGDDVPASPQQQSTAR